jgi:hypothetical protein
MGYTNGTAWAAEGARVALVSCEQCGAALIIDPRDRIDVLTLHHEWHQTTERKPT